MPGPKISPAGMKLLHRLMRDPITRTEENDRLAAALQNLISARAIGGTGVPEGWRWQIYDAGFDALRAMPDARAKRVAEDRAFNLRNRQEIEARAGVPAQYEMLGRAV